MTPEKKPVIHIIPKDGEKKKYFRIEFKLLLLIHLNNFYLNPEANQQEKDELKKIIDLVNTLSDLSVTLKKDPREVAVSYSRDKQLTAEEEAYFNNGIFVLAVAKVYNRADEYLEAVRKSGETPKRGKFKRSGHLQNQILKYNYPKDKDRQPTIFDQLEPETRDEVKTAKVEISELVEGIKLTPSQDKLLLCLSKILHEKSQTTDPQSKDYYTGNLDPLPYPNYGSKKAKRYDKQKETPTEIQALNKTEDAPKLAFTLYELTKEYKGGKAISGKDVDNVKAVLRELDNKQFLLSYIETIYKKDGGRIERKIEGFRKLIDLYKLSETEYGKTDLELSKKEETIVTLNPIFRHQIDNNFILYPTDINRRTIIAYGSHNVSETALRLRDYLIRELTYKHYSPEIGLDRLYWLLNEKWMREGRKKKVKEFTEKATDTVKALGLLLSYEITQGKTGEEKVTFKLNKDWE